MTAPDHRPPPADAGSGDTGDATDTPGKEADAPGGATGTGGRTGDGGGSGAPTGPRGPAAELMAAVRAVESGERSADSFFARPAPASRPAPARPAPAPPRADPGPGGSPGGEDRGPAPAIPPDLPALLERVGVPAEAVPALAGDAARLWGPDAAGVLAADPWQLLALPGTTPDRADECARALLGADAGPDDPRRVEALCVHLLERGALFGHTAAEPAALARALGGFGVPRPEEALAEAIEAGAAVLFEDPDPDAAPADPPVPVPSGDPGDPDGIGDAGEARETGDAEDPDETVPAVPVRTLVGTERWAVAEESLADGLIRLATGSPDTRPALPTGPPTVPGTAGDGGGTVRPGSSTAELWSAVRDHGLVVHTGGETARAEPLAVVAAARAAGLRAGAAVHRPDGVRRATAGVPGLPVVTCAGLLTGREGPGRDAEGTLPLDLLAVLDTELLDVEAAAALVEALPEGGRLILSGDPYGLESAGAGAVLRDLLTAAGRGLCPSVVSRTPDPGPIGELVSGVAVGELSPVKAPDREVVVVTARDAGEAVHRTVQLVTESIPRAFGVGPAATVVIVPSENGPVGGAALNAALKAAVNPGPGRFGGFDPGDRVEYREGPDRHRAAEVLGGTPEGLRLGPPGGVSPAGERGGSTDPGNPDASGATTSGADGSEGAGGTVTVPPERVADSVRHGWAVTARRATGRRWPAAVVVVPGDAGRRLDRGWLHTAFGRGERHLSVVQGTGGGAAAAVAVPRRVERVTRLPLLLRRAVAGPTGGPTG
ncbi:helix-hairpin-helix domain-containing protein [Streptomyces sp. ST2-7A]|uniref:helix-hairpin-helix domain-containing protein n=1 Tax=Streptomyces sp. ST2-7A TaxID=2907214 RepID=UPI0027E3870C|nr:helix-hairpin-helix domain-containing protein [Streptomyces sp. ST2-7A]